jgi:hypothetical protein
VWCAGLLTCARPVHTNCNLPGITVHFYITIFHLYVFHNHQNVMWIIHKYCRRGCNICNMFPIQEHACGFSTTSLFLFSAPQEKAAAVGLVRLRCRFWCNHFSDWMVNQFLKLFINIKW